MRHSHPVVPYMLLRNKLMATPEFKEEIQMPAEERGSQILESRLQISIYCRPTLPYLWMSPTPSKGQEDATSWIRVMSTSPFCNVIFFFIHGRV